MLFNAGNILRLAILFVLVTLGLCADSANFIAANKLAGGKLSAGGIYAFKYGSLVKGAGLGHVRLLVLWVEGAPGSLSVKTTNFDQVQLKSTGVQRYFGAACIANTADLDWNYDVKKASEYKFLGTVKPHTSKDDIKNVAAEVHDGKEKYNLITNNCNQFVNNIFKRIKARDLMRRALLEDVYFGETLSSRDLLESMHMVLSRRSLDNLAEKLYARAEENLYRRSLYFDDDEYLGDEYSY